jgi:hypothetical protein
MSKKTNYKMLIGTRSVIKINKINCHVAQYLSSIDIPLVKFDKNIFFSRKIFTFIILKSKAT